MTGTHRWNPNQSEGILGEEWLPNQNRSWVVGSTAGANTSVVQRFRAVEADTPEAFRIFGGTTGGTGSLLAELVEAGDYTVANVQIARCVPNDLTNITRFRNQAGSTVEANLLASIDETTDPSSLADWVGPTTVGFRQNMDIGFATAAAGLTGKRILAVGVGIRAMPQTGADLTDFYEVTIIETATNTEFGDVSRAVPSNAENWFLWGELCPLTGLPWTVADVEGFDNGDIFVRVATAGGDGIKFSRVRLVVIYGDENRVGFGTFSSEDFTVPLDPSDASTLDLQGTWSDDIPLYDVDGVLGPAIASHTAYDMLVRRPYTGNLPDTATLGLVMQVRDDGTFPPIGGEDADGADIDYGTQTIVVEAGIVRVPRNAPTSLPGSLYPKTARGALGSTEEPSGIFGVVLGTPAGPEPPAGYNGQPYSQAWFLQVAETFDQETPKDDMLVESITQVFPTDPTITSFSYASIRLLLGAPSLPAGDLIVTATTTDGVTTGSLTPEDLLAHPLWSGFGKHLLEYVVVLDPAVTIAQGDSVSVEITAPGTEDHGWFVGGLAQTGLYPLDTLADPPPYVQRHAGWGPQGQAPYIDFGSPPVTGHGHLAAYWQAALPGPSGFSVTGSSLPHPEVACADNCLLDLGYVSLGWNVGPIDPTSTRFILQRRDALDPTWRDIGYITDMESESFADQESRYNVATEWRIRVEAAEGQTSGWSDPASLTLPTDGIGYTFTTNWAPVSGIGYVDVYDGQAVRDYVFPDADEVLIRRFSGRDEFVVFRPSERRSETFQRRLLFDRILSADQWGPPAWQHLRDLSRAEVPYVCVRDEVGNRWFSGIILTGGQSQVFGIAAAHWGTLNVVPVSANPVPPTFS